MKASDYKDIKTGRNGSVLESVNNSILASNNNSENKIIKTYDNTINNKDVNASQNTDKDKSVKSHINSSILAHKSKFHKPKFEDKYQKDNFWLENDMFETLNAITEGEKGSKTAIINLALKDYFKKNKIEVIEFTGERKKKYKTKAMKKTEH
jgi:hypothetical protein